MEAPSASEVSSFGVLVLSGGRDRAVQSGRVRSHTRLFLNALEAARPRSMCHHGPVWVSDPAHPAPLAALPHREGEEALSHPFHQRTNQSHRLRPQDLSTSSRPRLLILSPLGVRVPTDEFGGDTSIQNPAFGDGVLKEVIKLKCGQ